MTQTFYPHQRQIERLDLGDTVDSADAFCSPQSSASGTTIALDDVLHSLSCSSDGSMAWSSSTDSTPNCLYSTASIQPLRRCLFEDIADGEAQITQSGESCGRCSDWSTASGEDGVTSPGEPAQEEGDEEEDIAESKADVLNSGLLQVRKIAKPWRRNGPFMVFCSHTKKSAKWDAEDFVQNQIWGYLWEKRISVFYDRYCLAGAQIESCLEAASRAKVMLVVLDDASPSDWMLREIRVAQQYGIKVQAIFREDKFLWHDVGKDVWKKNNVGDDVIRDTFKLPALPFSCNPIYLEAARLELIRVLWKLLYF